VTAGAAGFTDRAVRTGQRYRYRISTVYFDRSGARRVSPGLVGTAAPDVRPVPVDDLAAEAGLDGGPAAVRLTWTPPRTGAVGVRIGDRPPPWPAGSTITLADLAGYGRPVPGAPTPLPDGRAGLTMPAPTGRCFLTAISSGQQRAAVGNTVLLSLAEPVRGLVAERFAEAVLLRWIWPAAATSARVRWAPDPPATPDAGGPGRPAGPAETGPAGPAGAGCAGEINCFRREYEDNGGCTVTVGPDPVTVIVEAAVDGAAVDGAAGPRYGPAMRAAVGGLPARVSYLVEPARPLLRRPARLMLRCDRPVTVPPLLLVRGSGSVLPLAPADGTVVARVPSQRLVPDQPVAVPLAGARPGAGRLVCFPDGPSDPPVTLVYAPGRW
jgi:hypothetical protein